MPLTAPSMGCLYRHQLVSQIANGQQVLWDGNSYVMVSATLPGYPDVGDGEG